MAFDFVQEMETRTNPKSGQKYAPQCVESNLKAILSWAKWNRKKFEMHIKIADLGRRPSIENERVPTNDELRKVLYADTTPLRTRASIALMAFSGGRPEIQGNYLGLDGLRIRGFKELMIEEKEVTFTRVPSLVIVRAELSKSRHWYPTFMLEEGCEILKQYLDRRINEGEKLEPQSEIIVGTELGRKNLEQMGMSDSSPFIRTTKLGHAIRKAMRSAGLPWRPYIFRSYFDTMQMYAEGKGLISHTYSQVFMGHSGDIEATYTLRKAELPPQVLDDMREAYARVSEMLTTRKNGMVSKNEMLSTFNKRFLKLSNWTDKEIEALGDLSVLEEAKLQELIDRKSKESIGLNNGNDQKVIMLPELEKHINEGWEYVTTFNTDKAIVRIPKGG